jgi:hypothetical protein
MNRTNYRTQYRCDRQGWMDSVGVYVFDEPNNGKLTAWKMVPGDEIDQGDMLPPATMTLKLAQAQQLIDELWRVGLRPTEGSGSAGSLAATERHLKDMQGIAMALLRKDGAEVSK